LIFGEQVSGRKCTLPFEFLCSLVARARLHPLTSLVRCQVDWIEYTLRNRVTADCLRRVARRTSRHASSLNDFQGRRVLLLMLLLSVHQCIGERRLQ
jgi:hypothetical protein